MRRRTTALLPNTYVYADHPLSCAGPGAGAGDGGAAEAQAGGQGVAGGPGAAPGWQVSDAVVWDLGLPPLSGAGV